ncbi:hypothetical protein Acor_58390 [Acrocarpospora corrugata]|uniref:YbaK/aminoacyl-tRNA synthetase-associated domain-containing protein n=1 Tax=Acrocarpospora corrugata TaxID=35763 RepID=A0A5M3W9C7_9ACTN|nr:YbaK/EbsC family protein [Acrocarpospora corrugata]GES03773.1 hypothetical protein Acor_58390 [Acrocarpospora corrugata]
MQDALAIHRRLLAQQIHHEIVRLPRVLTCFDDLPKVLGVSARDCVGVTVFEVTIRSVREPVAVIGSVAKPPKAATVTALLGAQRVRLASAFLVNSATDYASGLVGPLLLPDRLTVLIDQRLIDDTDPDDLVYTATGERSTVLRLRAIHLFALVDAKPVDLTGNGRTG